MANFLYFFHFYLIMNNYLNKRRKRRNRFLKWFDFHEKKINSIATVALVLLTAALIIVTYFSIKATNSIKDVEIYLSVERQKEEIRGNIVIAKNLILEMNFNKGYADKIILTLSELKNRTEVSPDLFEVLRVVQARENPSFSDDEIKHQLEMYLDTIENIKLSLNEIKKAEAVGKRKIKTEHIDIAIKYSKWIVNGAPPLLKSDDIVKKIQDYIDEEEELYEKIEQKMREDILELTK